MRHIAFAASDQYPIALLIKASAFTQHAIEANYVEPLEQAGINRDDLLAVTLEYNSANKAPAAHIKAYLEELMPALASVGAKYLYVADAAYFKAIAGVAKADPHFGYALPCKLKGYEHMQVVLGLNYGALVYNPELYPKLDMSLNTLSGLVQGTYKPIGQGIIHSAQYPRSVEEIEAALQTLHQYPELSADIEAFSLQFEKAGIGTITFCWDQHNGIAFPVDYEECEEGSPGYLLLNHEDRQEGMHGTYVPNPAVRALVKKFLTEYKGRIAWHRANYDLKVIIYTLWMKDALDTKGLLEGLEVVCRSYDDTRLLAYLATNSTADTPLGLKQLAHEFAGNWAKEDINDIRLIPLPELLQYNLVDGLSTNYVRDKFRPRVAEDQQQDIYDSLFLPSQTLIIQMELTGMPLSPKKVAEARAKLEAIRDGHLKVIASAAVIAQLNQVLRKNEWEKDFESRRSKAKNPDKIFPKKIEAFDKVEFNPNSGPQLQILLYELLGLPVIDLTDTKQPATGADTLEKLANHCQEQAHKDLLAALIGHGKAVKVLNTFIPAFEAALDKGDGIAWLHGNFNLGGTVSGRLSSSDPNLQNIPAGSEYGKLIKSCFVGPAGWLFAGADFNSLEDYISALTTKDPNKLNVYIKGFDGHCLRAAYYFREELPHIDLESPESVNAIKKTHPELRQDSKAPTFLLTYGGTYHGMMSNLGWPEDKAKAIEANYHELYKVSDQYVADRLKQASKDGFVTVAFGLRVRTPLIKQVFWGSRSMPYEAAAEGRTAGNALGQSYGLLNNRAAVDFFKKVWASKYRYDILPVALIHDAIYILIRDDLEVVEWANRELIKSMQWQELPEIQHDTVKLGAALDIFWPSWATATTLPNNADRQTIINKCAETRQELKEKGLLPA